MPRSREGAPREPVSNWDARYGAGPLDGGDAHAALLEGGQVLVCLRAYLALSRADCCCHFVTAARGMQSSPHCGRFFKLIKFANNL